MLGSLKLYKTADELAKDPICHLQEIPSSALGDVESCEPEDEEPGELWQGGFLFENPGTWVAVFYGDKFYVGNTIHIMNPILAQVKFVEQTKIREDYFRWPRSDAIGVLNLYLAGVLI